MHDLVDIFITVLAFIVLSALKTLFMNGIPSNSYIQSVLSLNSPAKISGSYNFIPHIYKGITCVAFYPMRFSNVSKRINMF